MTAILINIKNWLVSAVRRKIHIRSYFKEMERYENKAKKLCIAYGVKTTEDESFENIRQFWKPYVKYDIKPYYYNILLGLGHSEPLYQNVNWAIMYNSIIRKLNPADAAKTLANKGLYATLFKDIHRPVELLRNCNGMYFNHENRIVSQDEAISLLQSYVRPFVIKPATDTKGGKNVKIVSTDTRESVISLLEEYKNDFVVQEVVEQSNQTGQFNPTSLNTFRVITLFLNGKVSVLSSILRCGGKDSIVDNASQGGMFVGIDIHTGVLKEGASYSQMGIKESPTGLVFSNYRIENIGRIYDLARQLHTRIPLCRFAAWDIALDKNDEPILIEVNLNKPDVLLMQICNGPVFGERFAEVMDYCFN